MSTVVYNSKRPDAAAASLAEAQVLISPGLTRKTVKRLAEGDVQVDVEKASKQAEGSKQLPPENNQLFPAVDVDVVDPPIDLTLWATQLSRSTRLNRAVRTIARNTVGLGWEIVPRVPFTNDTPESERKRIMDQAEKVRVFFDDANSMQPFESLMECAVMDEEATGNGYLEFTESAAGSLDKIFHVPSITVRILRLGRGFVQFRGQDRVFFKPFDETRVMDARNGKYEDEPGFASVERKDNPNGLLPVEHRASRLLHFKLYHPMSEVYGLPKFIAAGAAIAGNWHSSKRNVVFFVNDAVPRMAVLVSGGKLDTESTDTLRKYFQDGQGSEEAHRIIVLQTEMEGVGVDEKNTTRVELKPMTVGVTEDGSFLNYRVANDEEIREAMGLSEVYFRSIKLTKASATVAKATTDEQEFAPARKIKEHIFNKMVIWGELGASDVRIKFTAPETSDPLERAQVDKIYSEIGGKTPNEIRNELGMDPHPDSEEWADLPMPLAILAVQGQVVQASQLKMEPPETPSPSNESPPEPASDGDDEDDDEDDETGKAVVFGTLVNGHHPFVNKATEALRALPQRVQLDRK